LIIRLFVLYHAADMYAATLCKYCINLNAYADDICICMVLNFSMWIGSKSMLSKLLTGYGPLLSEGPIYNIELIHPDQFACLVQQFRLICSSTSTSHQLMQYAVMSAALRYRCSLHASGQYDSCLCHYSLYFQFKRRSSLNKVATALSYK
jgi:hypothetical protein